MAHNFKAKSEIVGQVMLFRDIIKNRGTLEVNPQGMGYISAYAKQIGINLPILKPGESYTFKHLEEWVNMVMFGETSYKTPAAIFGKTINLEKTAGTINQFVALNTNQPLTAEAEFAFINLQQTSIAYYQQRNHILDIFAQESPSFFIIPRRALVNCLL